MPIMPSGSFRFAHSVEAEIKSKRNLADFIEKNMYARGWTTGPKRVEQLRSEADVLQVTIDKFEKEMEELRNARIA
jgi:hypothetical protein